MTDDLIPDLEEITSFTPSPIAKMIVVGSLGLLGGVVIGLAISALMKEIDAEAPRIPTRVHDEVEEILEEIADLEDRPVVQADIKFPALEEDDDLEEIAEELGIDLTKPEA